jgi:hypothetical protein
MVQLEGLGKLTHTLKLPAYSMAPQLPMQPCAPVCLSIHVYVNKYAVTCVGAQGNFRDKHVKLQKPVPFEDYNLHERYTIQLVR